MPKTLPAFNLNSLNLIPTKNDSARLINVKTFIYENDEINRISLAGIAMG